MALGVIDTSQTGPSYSPLGTPLSSASCRDGGGEGATIQRLGRLLETTSKAELYPAASFYPLVNVVGEGFSGHEAARALGGVEGSFLQDDLALADYHQGAATNLGAFKNVVLHILQRGR